MSRPTKIGIAAGAVLALLLLALVALPYLFRDRIAGLVEERIGDAVAAHVEWERVGLSLLRSFPNPSVRVDGLTVTGRGAFSGDTLAAVERVRAAVSLSSVWRHWRRGEPVVVRSVDVERPVLRLVRLENGSESWRIAPEVAEGEAEEARPLAVSLRRFDLRDGSLSLEDREAGLSASVEGLRQSLQGDLSRDRVVLRTRTRADEVSVGIGGVPYLSRARLDLTADVEADLAEGRFTFRDNELRLNDLALAFAGSAAAVEEGGLDLDLTFSSLGTDFRHLLSLVPALYASDFEGLETSGTMDVSGRIEGRYGEDALPAFALTARARDGTFRYPDLPSSATGIALDLSVENPGGAGGDLDATVVEVSRFHAVIGGDPVEGALTLRTPVSDPDVDARVSGRLDLEALRRTVALEGVEELSGVVTADAELRTRRSWVEAGEYGRITARGGGEARDVTVRGRELRHPLFVDEVVVRLAPERVELPTFRARYGPSDIEMAGYLENVLAFVLREGELRGRASLESRRFHLDDWSSRDEELEVVPVPPRVDFTLDVRVDELTCCGTLEMADARGSVRLADQRATLEDFRVAALGGEVQVSGSFETLEVTRPTFAVEMALREVDIPTASRELLTVRTLAPVARYARGTVTTDLSLSGAVGPDLAPRFETLVGRGGLETSRVELEGFPALERIAEAVHLSRLANPALAPLRAAFDIADGRLHVRPFEVEAGDLRMSVSGSNGVDQSLDYSLRFEVPRALLGSQAEGAVEGLLSRAGRAGISLEAAETIELTARLTGTVTDPAVSTDVGRIWTSAREGVEEAVRDEAGRRMEELERRGEEISDEAQAEAARIIREAEARAEAVRQEARELAERVRREGEAAADSVLARATNPLARAAAAPAADRLRLEADRRADDIVRRADERADEIVGEANRRAEEILERPPDGGAGSR